MELFTGTVPENKNYVTGTVPANKSKKKLISKNNLHSHGNWGGADTPVEEFGPKLQ